MGSGTDISLEEIAKGVSREVEPLILRGMLDEAVERLVSSHGLDTHQAKVLVADGVQNIDWEARSYLKKPDASELFKDDILTPTANPELRLKMTAGQWNDLTSYLTKSEKVNAVRLVREVTGHKLKLAKEIVDQLAFSIDYNKIGK